MTASSEPYASGDNGKWEIIMHTTGKKNSFGGGTETQFGSRGLAAFKTATPASTGATSRTGNFTGTPGVRTAFYEQTNITKIALVDGSGNMYDPTSHTHHAVFDLLDGGTGSESLHQIINRLDTYNLNNASWAGNDSAFEGPSVTNFTSGLSGYSGLVSASSGTMLDSGGMPPTKMAIWGVNEGSDNDVQVLSFYQGHLAAADANASPPISSPKGDGWRGNNPTETYWSYWSRDWNGGSDINTISKSTVGDTAPGISTGATTNGYNNGPIYMLAFGSVVTPTREWGPFDGNILNQANQLDFSYGPKFTGTGALYNGTSSLGGISGAWLKLKIPHKIRLSYIDFLAKTKHPKDFKILGSNDDTNWVELINVVGNTGIGDTTRQYSVTSEIQAYKYFALVVQRVDDYSFAVSQLNYYGYEGDSSLGDTSVDTTFKSIMNTPQTTGANVYVDGSLGETFTNRVVGPTVSNTHTTYVSAEKYWELSGNVESNVTLEANTFLSGDAPHSLSMWFNSSNLVSNASNSCIFSLGTEERLDHVSAAFSNNYQTVQKFTAGSRSTTLANFGNSCAINSDGTRMIVGAHNEDNGGTNYGAVYIYTYSNGKWDDGVRIGAPTPVSGTSDQAFGRDVDINSAGTRVVVGAVFDDTGGTDAGAAYVYSYSNGTWTLDTVSGVSTGRIQASNAGGGDRFGKSVAMSGDGTKIIVGAIYEDTGATNAGTAYIYTYSGSSWGSENVIRAHDNASGGDSEFGWKVAMNNDGTKVVVGAPYHDLNASDGAANNAGAAYVFALSGSSWSEQAKIQASDIAAGDLFGYCVDINSDGTKIVIGAKNEDTGATDAGAAYVYTYSSGTWGSEQKIQASDKQANSEFGGTAAFNTDGTKLIVGAYHEDTGANDSGAAYIFAYDGSNWNEVVKLKAYDGAADDDFGFSVAISGDGTRVVVGADGNDDSPGTSSGSVYVYDRDTTHHLITDLKLQSNTWHNLTYAYQGEGGSRVTYLDGRKVAEDQAEDTFGDYPPFAMTGYSQGGYVVSASSDTYSTTGFYAWKAFNDVQGNEGWHTGTGNGATNHYAANAGGSVYDASLSGGTSSPLSGNLGDWIKLEMPHKLVVDYITLKARGTSSASTQSPKDFKILGSNDDINWDILESFTSVPYSMTGENHAVGATKGYKYIAFLVTRIQVTTNSSCVVGEIEYYGHRENDLVRLPDPTNVLKYPHIAMTGPAQRGYVVSGSTYSHFPASGDPDATWRSFDGITGDNAKVWKTYEMYTTAGVYSPGSYSRTASSITDTNSTQHSGEYLVLETPHKIKLSSWEVRAEYAPRRIVDYAILGSDTNSSGANKTGWTLLTSGTFAAQQDVTATVSSPTTAFKYHAIVVKSVTNNADSRRSQIHEMKLYGTGVDSIPIQIGGGNIDKVANFRVYDKFMGEDQALEIWDAQKDEFGRAKSSMTLQKGRLGIGTTEPEGRLAAADEPHNLEEFPPRAMTGYKNYFEGHGEFCVSASSNNTDSYVGWKAFNKAFFGGEGWMSSTTPDTYTQGTGVPNDTTARFNGKIGEWLNIDLPYKIHLERTTIIQRANSNHPRPTGSFTIWGSNDKVNWDEIITGTHTRTVPVNEPTGDPINRVINISKLYSSYRLQIHNIIVTTGNEDTCHVAEWKLFGTREQGQSVLHDGQLTLTKSLTVPRIGPALDADDTPRRDRLVVEYNTSTNPTFELSLIHI